jgi:hypothetical protein
MTRQEFNLWWQYYNIEPWGSELAQLNTGIISATVANCRQGQKAGSKSFKYADFMPYAKTKIKKRITKQTEEDIANMLMTVAKPNKTLEARE